MTARPKIGLVLPMYEAPISGQKPTWDEIRAMAIRAEELGVDTVWVPDELLWRPIAWPGARGFWECVAITGAVAAATSRIEVGTWVLSALHRNPGLTAKVAETLDEISGGRFLFGLGSGHAGKQGEAFGFPPDKTVGRFEEALQIIVPLLREGRADFHGEFHAATDLLQQPRGPRPGRIPLMIGAHGPRMMRLAARHADVWSAYGTDSSQPSAFVERFQMLDEACREVGRDPASIQRSVGIDVVLEDIAGAEAAGVTSPVAGTPGEIAATIEELAEMGATRVEIMMWPGQLASLEALASVLDRLGKEP